MLAQEHASALDAMLLPYASDRPPRNPPFAVVALVWFNFAVFGVTLIPLLMGSEVPVLWYTNLSLIPASLHWYAPLTYAFLHDNVFHLSVNMLFLWVFGGSVEDAIQWKRFLAFYLGAAVVTGMMEVGITYLIPSADRTTPIIGASGAVSAVVGVFAVRFYRSRIRFIGLKVRVPAVVLLALAMLGEMTAILYQLTRPEHGAQIIAHWAHIAGFLLGMLWAQATRLIQAGKHEYLAADAAIEMERGSPLAAARRWEQILLAQPNNLYARAELGRAWALVGDLEQSWQHYRHAIIGMLQRGNRAEAAARYREALDAGVDAVLPPAEQLAVANALEESGDPARALAAFERLLRTHPQTTEAEMAQLRIGVLQLRRMAAPERAVESLRTFLERYPHSDLRTYAEDLLRMAQNQVRR